MWQRRSFGLFWPEARLDVSWKPWDLCPMTLFLAGFGQLSGFRKVPEGRGYHPGFLFGVGTLPAIEPDVLPFKQTGSPSGSRLPGPKLPLEGGTWLIVALLGFASIVFNLLPAQLSLWGLAVIQLSNILFLVGPEIYLALGVSDNEPCFCCICSLPSPPC